VWLDYDGLHCSCIFSNVGEKVRECSHILKVKKTIGREEIPQTSPQISGDALSSFVKNYGDKI